MEKEINRIKAVLAEAGKTNVVGRTVGRKPDDGIEMVYEYLSAGFIHPLTNCRVTQREPQGFVASLKLFDYGRTYNRSI